MKCKHTKAHIKEQPFRDHVMRIKVCPSCKYEETIETVPIPQPEAVEEPQKTVSEVPTSDCHDANIKVETDDNNMPIGFTCTDCGEPVGVEHVLGQI